MSTRVSTTWVLYMTCMVKESSCVPSGGKYMNDKPHFEEGLGDIGSVNGQPVVCGNFQLIPGSICFYSA